MDYLEAFRSVRIQKGLTQEQLGQIVGHTKQYMYQIESGKTKLSYELAVKIADALEIELPIDAPLLTNVQSNDMKGKIRTIRRLRRMTLKTLRSCVSEDMELRTLYFMSIVDRAVRLSDGFVLLLKERNLTCAGAVLRLVLDNCMRTYAYTLAEDKEAVATRGLKPEVNLGNLRDKEGRRLTDEYLAQKLSKLDETIGSLYRQTNGNVHLSSKAFYNMTSLRGNRSLNFNIGGPLPEEWDATLLECADAFIRYLALNNRLVLDAIADIPLDAIIDDSTIVNK